MLLKNSLFFWVLLLSFNINSCAFSKTKLTTGPKEIDIRPGEVRWVQFPVFSSQDRLYCREQLVKFEFKSGEGRAFITESYFSDLTPYSCVLHSEDKKLAVLKISVKEREYLAEKLKVDQKKIKLAPADELRVQREQAQLNKIYQSSIPEFLFTQSFIQPMKTQVTSVYGTKRVYNKQKKGQHLGIDYRASIGENVPAANAGKIVFSGDLFFTGWTVIIDHGMDIFTVYGHLSKTLVTTGDIVKRGDLIGLSGNTGRTSGPHLHWGTKVQGQYIDGFVLIEESKKNFIQ